MLRNKTDLSINLNSDNTRTSFGRRKKTKENSYDLHIDYNHHIHYHLNICIENVRVIASKRRIINNIFRYSIFLFSLKIYSLDYYYIYTIELESFYC